MQRREFLACAIVTPLVTACGGAASPPEPGETRAKASAATADAPPAGNAIFSGGGQHALGWDAAGNWTMDGAAFQFFGGEMHPSRVPSQYWDHRIRMIKALGCNTISLYVMWNFHERADGSFDFASPDKDIGHFIDLCAANGLWVILRPGPYVCAEWDFGGLPPRMLADPQFRDGAGNLQIRGNFPAYMAAVQKWNAALYASVVHGRTLAAGGPIMLVAVENEYTYWYPDDTTYPDAVAAQWTALGYAEKFCVCDGSANGFKGNGITLPANTAYGMTADGASAGNYPVAAANYGVGVFGAECYPGWICNWGDGAQTLHVGDFVNQVSALARARCSFVMYVAHGGTNFGFTGGGNGVAWSGCEPVLTSYDYGAPVAESGEANANFTPIRNAYVASASYDIPFVAVPAGIAHVAEGEIATIAASQQAFAALLPDLKLNVHDTLPHTVESLALTLNQKKNAGAGMYPAGVAVYQASLPAAGGRFTITFDRAPDFALAFVDGVLVPGVLLCTVVEGAIKPAVTSFTIANAAANATLRIVCMPFGRSNFGAGAMNVDGRGLSGNVYANGVALKHWTMTLSPLSAAQIAALKFTPSLPVGQPFFAHAALNVAAPKDMYIDMSDWGSGYVFVNGRNLGRYWTAAGPQKRLYCPGAWLAAGGNSVVVFEFTQPRAGSLAFHGASALPLAISNPVSTGVVPPPDAGATYFLQNVNSGLYLDVLPPVAGAAFTYPGQLPFSAAATQGWKLATDSFGNLAVANASTGAVLDVAASGQSPGSAVILYAANGGANQSWQANGVAPGIYTLTGKASALLLDVSGQSKAPTAITSGASTAALVVEPKADANTQWPFSQQWRFIPAVFAGGIYTLTVAASKLMLGTYQAATAAGTLLAIAAATGGTEQQWQLLGLGGGNWQLKNMKSGLLMDIGNHRTDDSAPVEVWSANGGANQSFTLVPRPDGRSYAIRGVESGRVVDANGSGTAPTSYGTNPVSAITLWGDNGGANQSWVFDKVG